MQPVNGMVDGIVPPTSPVTLAGGTLSINDNPSYPVNETLVSTTITGFGPVLRINNSHLKGVQLNLGTITRNGGVLDLPNTALYTTPSPNVNGILGGYLTVNGYTDWAANSDSGIVGLAVAGGAGYSSDSYAVGNNVDVQTGGILTVSATANSLRFNTPTANNLALGGNTLTLQSGGILVTPNLGSSNLGITGGALTASGTTASNTLADVVVLQGDTTAPFTVGANITNNGTISIGLTKGGPGTLILAGSNTFSGPISVSAGTLQGSLGSGNFPTATTSIAVNGGANVTFNESGPTPVSTAITINGAGTVTKAGPQILTTTGGFPSGGVNVVGGVLNLGNVQTISGPVAISAGETLGMVPSPGLLTQFYLGVNNLNNSNPDLNSRNISPEIRKLRTFMVVYVRIDMHEHNMHDRGSRRSAWSFVDRGTGTGNFPSRGGSRGHGPYDDGRKTGRFEAASRGTDYAFGHDSALPEATGQTLAKETGSEAGAQGPSSATPCTHRPATRASVAVLPALPGSTEALPANPHPLHRGYSRGDHSSRDRTYDPSRLVPAVQEVGRAQGSRRLAGGDVGQPYRHDDGLDALRAGQHALADRRGVQLPSADEAHRAAA